ncbi:MAG: superoxide dismutase [Porphyromonas sp.]|nr:superoxide dismutase [Porphyromonas sp.]
MKGIHIATLGLALMAGGFGPQVFAKAQPVAQVQTTGEAITLVALPYATDALAPVISKQTIELHHGKHLQGYVNNVNKLRQGTKWANADLETIVRESEGTLFNNAGQVLNHNLYFTQFSPKPKHDKPEGKLQRMIAMRWGSFAKFQEAFEAAGATLFGSGWIWLSQDDKGELQISLHSGGDNPITRGWTSLMGIDLWEHAYYLDYQNKRADHLKAVWTIIDWSVVAKRLR